MSASLNMCAFLNLGGLVYPGYFTLANSLAPPLLIALGGIIEGLFAETVFDQKIHLFSFAIINAGFWLELNMITKGGIMLSGNFLQAPDSSSSIYETSSSWVSPSCTSPFEISCINHRYP